MTDHKELDIELDRNIVDQILSVYPDVMIIATFWKIYQIIEDENNLPLIDLYSSLLKQDYYEISGAELRSKIATMSLSSTPPTDRSLEMFIKNGLLDCGEHIFLNENDRIQIDQILTNEIKQVLIEKKHI